MKTKFSPGPWDVQPFVDAIFIVDVNGDRVAELSDRRFDMQGMPPANARLINAAPELLTICEKILAILSHPTNHVTMIEQMELEKVIAKAT